MVLKNVRESEEEVLNMLNEVGSILENNFPGPEIYITYYETYAYLLNGTEIEALETFFGNEPFPLLSVGILVFKYRLNDYIALYKAFYYASR